MEIARARKQILTYNASILNVPNQNNTPLVIDLKNYINSLWGYIKKLKI